MLVRREGNYLQKKSRACSTTGYILYTHYIYFEVYPGTHGYQTWLWHSDTRVYRLRRCISHYHTPHVVYHTPHVVYHTPLCRLSMVDTSSAAIVSVPKKVGVGNMPRYFRRRNARYWRPLGCRAIELGKKRSSGV